MERSERTWKLGYLVSADRHGVPLAGQDLLQVESDWRREGDRRWGGAGVSGGEGQTGKHTIRLKDLRAMGLPAGGGAGRREQPTGS